MDIKDIEKYLIGKYLYWDKVPFDASAIRKIFSVEKSMYGGYELYHEKLESFRSTNWDKQELINLIYTYKWAGGNGCSIYLLDNKNQADLIRLLYG
jgi:hypothetical protein